MRMILKLAALAIIAAAFAGCASDPIEYNTMPREHGKTVVEARAQKPLQCVPYAREHSAIKIFGDANTWWDKAAGKYARGAAPDEGAVMVLHDYGGSSGHVAVVKTLVSAREIRIDHANWLNDGSIYVNDPVLDVSENNDWSKVRIYNIKSGGWGTRIYPVQGFIGSHRDTAPDHDGQDNPDLVADSGTGHMGRVALLDDSH